MATQPAWNKGKPAPWAVGNKHCVGAAPTSTSFKPGNRPWQTGRKGIHLSPATEFKPGVPQLAKRAAVGEVRIRKSKGGSQRAHVKVADPNKWRLRAVVVWEAANGQILKGKLIHHDDRDTLNDDLANLICLTRAEHIDEHRADITEARHPSASSAVG